MNQNSRRSGIGAYTVELERIKIFINNAQRRWFTAADVGINGRALQAMTKRNLLRIYGVIWARLPKLLKLTKRNLLRIYGGVGSKRVYELRNSGWVRS